MNNALLDLIESSLEFHYYRGGNIETTLRNDFHSQPFMVVGQVVNNGYTSTLADGTCLQIDDGCGYCAPAQALRKAFNYNDKPAMFHWAHIDFFIGHKIDLARFIPFPSVFAPKFGIDIGRINRRLLEIHQTECLSIQQIAERKRLGMELFEILIKDINSDQIIQEEQVRLLNRMQPVLQYIHEHIQDPIQTQRLASLFDLSNSRFHELFSACTGTSPGHYQLQIRLQQAQVQLTGTNKPIKDIAESCGFEDNHYFSRIFKKMFGLSPSQYRNSSAPEQPA